MSLTLLCILIILCTECMLTSYSIYRYNTEGKESKAVDGCVLFISLLTFVLFLVMKTEGPRPEEYYTKCVTHFRMNNIEIPKNFCEEYLKVDLKVDLNGIEDDSTTVYTDSN